MNTKHHFALKARTPPHTGASPTPLWPSCEQKQNPATTQPSSIIRIQSLFDATLVWWLATPSLSLSRLDIPAVYATTVYTTRWMMIVERAWVGDV